jgi:hypothetical protein
MIVSLITLLGFLVIAGAFWASQSVHKNEHRGFASKTRLKAWNGDMPTATIKQMRADLDRVDSAKQTVNQNTIILPTL